MNQDSKWILIVGFGSIGKRHYNNLLKLGWRDIGLVRTHRNRPSSFQTPENTKIYHSLESALEDKPFIVIVANPTSLHYETTLQSLESGAKVILEKPVAANLEHAQELLDCTKRLDGLCSVAYNFRYHPLYAKAREWVLENRIGRIFYAHTWQSGYLPDWHPWEDYRSGYAARADLGGGVVKTLDHDLDFLHWTFGKPLDVMANADKLSNLDLDVEDTADMLFRFSDGINAHAHVSFARWDPARGLSVVGENGSIIMHFFKGDLILKNTDKTSLKFSLPPKYDLNDTYLNMLKYAIEGFNHKQPFAQVPLENGFEALNMAINALNSSAKGSRIQNYREGKN